MLIQLILATIMVLLTVIIHLLGLAVLIRLLRSHHRVMRAVRFMPLTLLLGASLGILAIHTIEIWAYAALYLASDEAKFVSGAILPVDGAMGVRIG